MRTEEAYVDWIRRFILFHKTEQGSVRHPREMGTPEIRAFLAHLATEGDIAAAVQQLVPEATTRYTDQDILTEISFDVDTSKLTGMGFTPQVSLEEGLREVLERWKGF